jgi:hypothetical protein
MDIQTAQAVSPRNVKRRAEGLKLLLVAGLSVQVWGVVMGLGLIILNLTH